MRRREVLDFTAGAPRLSPRGSRQQVLAGALATPARSVHCVDVPAGEPPVVALTWDDGPDPAQTPGVLDALAAAGARATFFVLVARAEAHPQIVRRMLSAGHEVGLHGIDHRRLSALPWRDAARLVREGRRRLERVTGRPVTLFRPPYGAQSPGQLLATRALGLQVVLWSAWAVDWQDDDAQEVADRALAAVHPGAVVLLHDAYGEAVARPDVRQPVVERPEVARLVLAGLAERGVSVVPAGELLARYPAVTTVWTERG